MASAPIGAALHHIHRLFAEGSLAGLPDAQLLDRFVARRDELAFAALVGRHGPMVLATCRAILRDPDAAEDAFQATFLSLVHKAHAVRDGEALGGWLHRVARRVAARAHADDARRLASERQAGALKGTSRTGSGHPDDLLALLHAEVDRLPARYRLPIVLHHLEGRPQAEVARRLRWSERTLRRRLVGARERLHARLVRRGVAPTVATLAAASGDWASAAVPAGWAERTARAAASVAAGRAAAPATVTCSVLALVEGASRATFAVRPKAVEVALLATLGIAWVAAGIIAADPASRPLEAANAPPERSAPGPAEPSTGGPAAPAAAGEAPEAVYYAGRVLGPDDRPVAGAEVRLVGEVVGEGERATVRARTDEQGGFRFRVPTATFDEAGSWWTETPWAFASVVAKASGLAPGWARAGPSGSTEDLTLRLAIDDRPIEGRILDLQGRPVPGATVKPRWILAPERGDLSAMLEAARTGRLGATELENQHLPGRIEPDALGLPQAVTTDDGGSFRLAGVGRERVAVLIISGAGLRYAEVRALTRPVATFDLTNASKSSDWGVTTYHGATFDHAAAPSRPIVGVVRDKDTGAPLPGVTVRSEKFAEFPLIGAGEIETTTDAQGRFRLEGMPPGPGNQIVASAPPDRPYLPARIEVGDGAGLAPVSVEIALKRGLWIEGRVTEAGSGEPIRRGIIQYGVFLDNPHFLEAPGLDGAELWARHRVGPDGTYRVPGLPGRGVVASIASKSERYLSASELGQDAGRREQTRTAPRPLVYRFCNAVVEVDAPEEAESVRCDIVLHRGRALVGTVVGPDGEPLAGARLTSPQGYSNWEGPLKDAGFRLEGLPRKVRKTLLFRHDDRRLVGALTLDPGDPEAEPRVRLEPWGVVTGRIVDDEGRPRAEVNLMVYASLGDVEFSLTGPYASGSPWTDRDGRFRIEGLIPGLAHEIRVRENGHFLKGFLAKGLTIKSGEVRDLGDVEEAPR